MTDVFDIMMRIGVTDEITGALSKIGGALDELHTKVESIADGFKGLMSTVGGLGTALTGLATAAALGFDKLAEQGDKLSSMYGRLRADNWSTLDIATAKTMVYATAAAIPGTHVENLLKLLQQLRSITGQNVDELKPLLDQMATLQLMGKEWGGAGGPKAVEDMFRLFTGMGLSQQAALKAIEGEMRSWIGGVVTPEQSVQTLMRMKETGKALTPDFLTNVLPWLEQGTLPGRGNVGAGLLQIFEKMNEPNPKTGNPKWFDEGVLGAGTSIRQYGNDPYQFAQSAARLLQGQGVNLQEAARHTGPDLEQVHRYIEGVLKLHGTAADAMTKMITEGEVALGKESPIARMRARPEFQREERLAELAGEPGVVRAGMYTAISNFITTLGEAIGKWEVPKMQAITEMFNRWTNIVKDADAEKMDRIISISATFIGVLGGIGVALLTLYGAAILFSPAGIAVMGLMAVAGAITAIYQAWDKNKNIGENISHIKDLVEKQIQELRDMAVPYAKAFGEALLAAIRKEDWVTDFNQFGGWVGNAIARSLREFDWFNLFTWLDLPGTIGRAIARGLMNYFSSWVPGLGSQTAPPVQGATPSTRPAVPGVPGSFAERFGALPGGGGLRPALTDSFSEALKNAANKLQTTQTPPRGFPSIGPVPWTNMPFTAPPVPSFRDRWIGSTPSASPVSFTGGGGPIMPSGGGQRQKGVTIATNLNIDGRLLAQAISDHILSMMTDPSSAGAADGVSLPPGAGYAAA